MTTYGTISANSPSQPSPQQPSSFIACIRSSLTSRRPWREMIQPSSFSFPCSLTHSIDRIRTNVALFRINYAIIASSALLMSLLCSPLSFLFLTVVVFLWVFLFFFRQNPLVFFGRVVDDGIVMTSLLLATFALVFFTDVTHNITVGLGFGVVVILAHGALWSLEGPVGSLPVKNPPAS